MNDSDPRDQSDPLTGEIVESTERALVNISGLSGETNVTLAAVLSKAELDQRITTARVYPRSITLAVQAIKELATLDKETAEECQYGLPRGRDPKTGKRKILLGPSVRLAEIAACQWGNCTADSRVTHTDTEEGWIESEGTFHDLQTNYAVRSRVRRSIRGKDGRIFSADMIVVTGNAANAIAFRNAVFKGIPKGVWRPAYSAVEATIRGDMKTLSANRLDMLLAYKERLGMDEARVFAILGVPGEGDIGLDEIVAGRAFFSAIKNGEVTAEDLIRQLGPTPGTRSLADANKGTAPAPPPEPAQAAPAKETPPVPARKAKAAPAHPTKTDGAQSAGGERDLLASATPASSDSAAETPGPSDSFESPQNGLEDRQEAGESSPPTFSASSAPDTARTSPAEQAFFAALDGAKEWADVARALGGLYESGAVGWTPPESLAFRKAAWEVAETMADRPAEPGEDPLFFSVWLTGALKDDIASAWSALVRTPQYRVLDTVFRDVLAEETDFAERK